MIFSTFFIVFKPKEPPTSCAIVVFKFTFTPLAPSVKLIVSTFNPPSI